MPQFALPNYKDLVSTQSIKNFPTKLTAALETATQIFKEILLLPAEKQNFNSVVSTLLESQTEVSQLYTFINNYNSTNSDPAIQTIVEDFQAPYIEYSSMVSTSTDFFDILKNLEKNNQNYSPEQNRSLELILRDMEMSGVGLPKEKKQELQKINTELAHATEKFSQHTVKSRAEFSYHFEDKKFLEEVPNQELQEAKNQAKKEKKTGYVFTLSPPSAMAILKYCRSEKIREIFYQANSSVASQGEYDNKPLALKILKLRQQKVEILGHNDFAEYILQERMAENTQQVLDLLHQVVQKSKPIAEQELAELEKFAEKKMNPWDLSYYAEKLRKEKFSLDEKELQKFFPFSTVLHGMFDIAKKIFGIEFTKLEIQSYDESVTSYVVTKDNTVRGYYILDPFTRSNKRAGAWCNNFRDRWTDSKTSEHITPIMVNVMNFPEGEEKNSSLLSHRDVETLFHEFGHAMHMILGETNISNISGFETEWDFVELPSQLLENWCWQKESLALITGHIETKEKISKEMISALKASKNFGSGMHVLRQNEFSLLDLILHSEEIPQSIEELDQKCNDISKQYSIIQKPEYSRMYCSFSHIFAGGYAAGYYSYLWAEILEADVFKVFMKEGILNPEVGNKYREKIIAPGSMKNGGELFQDFMGRAPKIDAYLEKVGLK